MFNRIDTFEIDGYISKDEFMTFVNNNIIPSRFDLYTVKVIFQSINKNEIDLSTFAIFSGLIHKFNQYTKHLNINQMFIGNFLAFLHDRTIPLMLRKMIDSIILDSGTDIYTR